MDLEVLANLSWREALIAVIALLALYVAIVVVRMQRLKHAAQQPTSTANPFSPAGAAAYQAAQPLDSSPPAQIPPENTVSGKAEPVFAWNEPPEPYDKQQQLALIERDLMQLRREISAMRAELRVVDENTRALSSDLREEWQRELAQTRAMQNTSPLYSDAMQMATDGHDAATIAAHCGIARAEAELVVALVRNRDTLD